MSQLTHFGTENGSGISHKRVVVIHRQNREWRVVTMLRDEEDRRPRLDELSSVSVADISALERLIDKSDADTLVRILPSGTVVCRTFGMPRMDEGTMSGAIDLQAEAVLPSTIESHRRAAALLPWSEEVPDEFEAVAVGWPGDAPDDFSSGSEIEQRFAPSMSCLVECLCYSNGNSFAAYLDRDLGTFELLMHHRGRTGVRTVRIDISQSDWVSQVEQAFVETAMSLGIDLQELEPWRAKLRDHAADYPQMPLVDDETSDRFLSEIGQETDSRSADSWEKYGMALLAGAGVLGPRRNLFSMRTDPPEEQRNVAVDILQWIDRPSRAAIVLVAALLAIAVIPYVSAWSRYAALKSKIGTDAHLEQQVIEIQQTAQFYELLNKKRWPMTKLIADISGSAPYLNQIDELTIDSESGEVRLKGTSPGSDDLTVFREVLGTTGIFDRITVPRSETKANKVEFEMTFSVVDPNKPAERAFTDSLAHHLYPDQADQILPGQYEQGSPTVRPSLGRGGGTASRSSARSAMNMGGAAANQNKTSAPITSGSSAASSQSTQRGPIPEPLSDQQIESMNYQQALASATARTKFMYDRSLDESTRTRLRDEFGRLYRRSQELKPKKD